MDGEDSMPVIPHVVIGGGVSGLAAANRLLDKGERVRLLEAGTYPQHRVCGEFLSPECLPLLETWGIRPAYEIKKAVFKWGKKEIILPFEQPAGTLPRTELERQLLQRAVELGADISTGTAVDAIDPGTPHTLTLSTGETIKTSHLTVSAGRAFQPKPEMAFTGMKAHFRHEHPIDTLTMRVCEGGYYGIAPVAPGIVNVAILSELGTDLRDQLDLGEPCDPGWITTQVPLFGHRTTPSWNSCTFIGDARAAIPPATGLGLTSALLSDRAPPIAIGKMLHWLMMHPMIGYPIGRMFSSLLYRLSRPSG
jgi:flavin-dependent dehydrogenase